MTIPPKTKGILKELIYEMDEGNPIYYRGYKKVLLGTRKLEEIMGDSSLQAWMKGKIFLVLSLLLSELDYELTVGEHGLTLGKKSWRAADIAIFKKQNLKLNKHYSKQAPEIVIEIDTKAEIENLGEALEYYDKKTGQLLDFGVKKVIWIFTDSKKIRVLSKNKPALNLNWEEDIPVIEEITFNILKIFEQFNQDIPES